MLVCPTFVRKMSVRTQLQCSFFLSTVHLKNFRSLYDSQNNSHCGVVKTLREAIFGFKIALYLESDGLDLNLCNPG